MIIGFDGSRAFGTKRTGTENYSYQILKNLAKIDHKNQYIVYLRSKGILLQSWPNNFKFEILNFKFLWTQAGLSIQTFKDKLDVLFVPAHTLPLIRRPGLKTVVTVHDLGSEYLPQAHQIKQRLYLSLMQNYQLKTATKLIAVSNSTKQDLVKKIGIDPEKISVVYEGYDQDKFKILNLKFKNDLLNSVMKSYDIEKNKYFLFVGTVQPRKNLERIIEAFAKYSSSDPAKRENREVTLESSRLRSNNKLVIVGKKGWKSEEIYALPKKLGIAGRVKFLDYVKDADLPALYSGAKALVYPSLFEGFGLPILEAQACGCPVITSNISSMPEVAGAGAILVNPYSVEEITDAMIRVKGKAERVKLIKKGLENVKRFSWEKCAKETLRVLESTM